MKEIKTSQTFEVQEGEKGPEKILTHEEVEIRETSDPQDSVEVKQSAKGDISFSVKCYRETSDEASVAAKKTLAGLQTEYTD